MQDSVDRHVAVWARELDWLDPVREAIAARLMIVARHASQARREVLDADGLKHWQYKVLLTLRRSGPPYESSPSVLAERLGLTRGALSARLGPIEEAGLITRTHETGDRRRVRVRLTDAGHAAFEAHAAAEDADEGALLSVLSEAERRTLADLLRKLVLAVEGGPGAAAPGPPGPRRSRSAAR
ncbi:MarR family transcriptional regulator [Streptomyces fodineus]|uniref:MarR family transcriptional regulator n=1 Tax=Streptomyces fodineus TaxID=1904616 RepID=A0A1D7Y3V0_9ACTN|nr:MarR family transcriptional regulator [Streptomyces fodineus]AOR30255.1 MarR family transcriptional regulator [Streptomyces fodineus]